MILFDPEAFNSIVPERSFTRYSNTLNRLSSFIEPGACEGPIRRQITESLSGTVIRCGPCWTEQTVSRWGSPP